MQYLRNIQAHVPREQNGVSTEQSKNSSWARSCEHDLRGEIH